MAPLNFKRMRLIHGSDHCDKLASEMLSKLMADVSSCGFHVDENPCIQQVTNYFYTYTMFGKAQRHLSSLVAQNVLRDVFLLAQARNVFTMGSDQSLTVENILAVHCWLKTKEGAEALEGIHLRRRVQRVAKHLQESPGAFVSCVQRIRKNKERGLKRKSEDSDEAIKEKAWEVYIADCEKRRKTSVPKSKANAEIVREALSPAAVDVIEEEKRYRESYSMIRSLNYTYMEDNFIN